MAEPLCKYTEKHQMGIRAQNHWNCVKQVKSFRKEPLVHICKWESVPSGASHGQSPLKILISALNYKISLMSSLILTARTPSGVRISLTSGQ